MGLMHNTQREYNSIYLNVEPLSRYIYEVWSKWLLQFWKKERRQKSLIQWASKDTGLFSYEFYWALNEIIQPTWLLDVQIL